MPTGIFALPCVRNQRVRGGDNDMLAKYTPPRFVGAISAMKKTPAGACPPGSLRCRASGTNGCAAETITCLLSISLHGSSARLEGAT